MTWLKRQGSRDSLPDEVLGRDPGRLDGSPDEATPRDEDPPAQEAAPRRPVRFRAGAQRTRRRSSKINMTHHSPCRAEDGDADRDGDANGGEGVRRDVRQRGRPRHLGRVLPNCAISLAFSLLAWLRGWVAEGWGRIGEDEAVRSGWCDAEMRSWFARGQEAVRRVDAVSDVRSWNERVR